MVTEEVVAGVVSVFVEAAEKKKGSSKATRKEKRVDIFLFLSSYLLQLKKEGDLSKTVCSSFLLLLLPQFSSCT